MFLLHCLISYYNLDDSHSLDIRFAHTSTSSRCSCIIVAFSRAKPYFSLIYPHLLIYALTDSPFWIIVTELSEQCCRDFIP